VTPALAAPSSVTVTFGKSLGGAKLFNASHPKRLMSRAAALLVTVFP